MIDEFLNLAHLLRITALTQVFQCTIALPGSFAISSGSITNLLTFILNSKKGMIHNFEDSWSLVRSNSKY